MRIYPAIDLLNGEVVRLRRGNPSDVKVFNSQGSPIDIARMWESQGAELLHVIDLDGAIGKGNNQSMAESIASELSIPVQFGGGVRDGNTLTRLLGTGIERVILGTLAIRAPDIVLSIGEAYGFDRVVVALDYRNNRIVCDGWQSQESTDPKDLLASFRDDGISHFLMTSVEKDGEMKGPDSELASSCGGTLSDIIIAGGITSIEDVKTLAAMGFEAAVIGRALYEGAIKLTEAISVGRRFTS